MKKCYSNGQMRYMDPINSSPIYLSDGKPYYTITEAARRCGVTPVALKKAIQRGTLHSVWHRSLNRRLIPAESLTAYFSSPSPWGRPRKSLPRKVMEGLSRNKKS